MPPTSSDIRAVISWNADYNPVWDGSPNLYLEADLVGWGKSRRLGVLRTGPIKAYVGLQHVDTTKRGWNISDEPHTRFFASLFVNNRVVTLRTFSTMQATLEFLSSMVNQLS